MTSACPRGYPDFTDRSPTVSAGRRELLEYTHQLGCNLPVQCDTGRRRYLEECRDRLGSGRWGASCLACRLTSRQLHQGRNLDLPFFHVWLDRDGHTSTPRSARLEGTDRTDDSIVGANG